jgi:ribosomal protein S12 methylthiotransferase
MALIYTKNLAELFRSIGKVEGIEWIRLHYAFLQVFYGCIGVMKREPKICNYIDIPLQHFRFYLKINASGNNSEKTTNY